MATPSTGSISMSDIAAEFGGIEPHSINEYHGAAPGVATFGAIDFNSLRGKSVPNIVDSNLLEVSLRGTSVPDGMFYNPDQSSLLTGFAADGYRTAGNGDGKSYELRTSNRYAGDTLFETSVLITGTANDPSIAISPDMGNAWWMWGSHWSRIAFTFNFRKPHLYGTSTWTHVGQDYSTWGPGVFYTMHLHHQPSQNRTRAWATRGLNDWENETSNRVGNIVTIANSYSTSSQVECGLSSDFDGAGLSVNSTNFQSIRVKVGY